MATENQQNTADNASAAVAAGGSYEIIRTRMQEQGKSLSEQIEQLNQSRSDEFGKSDMSIIGRIRACTENNCASRDIVRVGEYLLFAYNVYIGLKRETSVGDVFSLYKLIYDKETGQYDIESVAISDTFLTDKRFQKEFSELYSYYKHARLLQLQVKNSKLFASFQIGNRITDLRVFRWQIDVNGDVQYIDNRGEREVAFPARHDFEWTESKREDQIHGKYPHISILDSVFVECINGDLTAKIENNTDDGLGIYVEDVKDHHQSLDDADISYAQLGQLILLKVLPYREEQTRYLVYNPRVQKVSRIDAIGQACIQLPEDHGIIFPGGYYLQDGTLKIFDDDIDDLRLNVK